jgi:hypothetical protein
VPEIIYDSFGMTDGGCAFSQHPSFVCIFSCTAQIPKQKRIFEEIGHLSWGEKFVKPIF